MAQLPQAANTEGNDEGQGFVPIPEGEYTLAIVKSEFKDTKAGTGKYLNLEMSVQEGEMKGRRIWEMLNLINPNKIAVEIANKTLNSICKACGLRDVEDSDELHGIPFQAKVGIEPATADWPAKNKINRYIDPNESSEASNLPWE